MRVIGRGNRAPTEQKNTAATKQVAAMKIAPVSRFYRRIRDKKIRAENKSEV